MAEVMRDYLIGHCVGGSVEGEMTAPDVYDALLRRAVLVQQSNQNPNVCLKVGASNASFENRDKIGGDGGGEGGGGGRGGEGRSGR